MSPLSRPDAAAAASGCRMVGGMRSAANWIVEVAPGGIGPTVSMWLGWKWGMPVDTCMKPGVITR
eukprot:scaffold6949_cov61-Phaeocystis_antarctica.AAC.3